MKEKTLNEFINYNKRIGKILIAGIEGRGKTLLLTAIAVGKMLNGFEDCIKSYKIVDEYNRLGYGFSKNYEHLLFSNFPINCKGTAYSSRRCYRVKPFRLGYYDSRYYTDFFPPYALFCITEGKLYFDAYKWEKFPNRFIGWLKTMRQAKYDMVIDSQDFGDICKPFRKVTNRFVLLSKDIEEIKDTEGKVTGHKLYITEWKDLKSVELYEMTSKKENCEEYVLKLDKCYYENYDTNFCRYLHLLGREDEDFTIEYFPEIGCIEDIYSLAEDLSSEPPEGFFPIRIAEKKEAVNVIDEEEYLEV